MEDSEAKKEGEESKPEDSEMKAEGTTEEAQPEKKAE